MTTDAKTIRLVIGGLVIITLAFIALIGIIAVHDHPSTVPEALWTLLGVAVGALAAMLARTSSTSDQPPQVAPTAEHFDTP